TAVAALTIPCNNIHLQGAGKLNTTLSLWISYNGAPPVAVTDICPQNQDFTPSNPSFTFYRTWRGSMIYIVGSTNPAAPTDNISVTDMSLIGNAVINGNSANPVRQDNSNPVLFSSQCNAWDTSHKGIYLQNTTFTANPGNGAFYNAVQAYYANL